jgi:hypothetical protein
VPRTEAILSEVDSSSQEENASKQANRARLLQSEPARLWIVGKRIVYRDFAAIERGRDDQHPACG